jgi:hypothetical protein
MELRRVGIYFFLIGFLLLGVFFISDQSQNPQFELFLGGAILVGLGGFLSWRFRPPATPSGRFSLLGKMKNRSNTKKKK